MLLENEATAIMFWAKSTEGRSDLFKKTLHSWWKRKVAFPVSQIDDDVKDIFRETNLRKLITGRIWVQKDRGKSLWTKGIIMKSGRRCEALGQLQV